MSLRAYPFHFKCARSLGAQQNAQSWSLHHSIVTVAVTCFVLGIRSVEAADPLVKEMESPLEWHVDLYGGLTFPGVSDLSLDSKRTGFVGTQFVPATASSGIGPTGGLRVTAWFPNGYTGGGLDMFYVNPTIQVDTPAVTVPGPGAGLCCSQTIPAERQQFSFSVIGLGIDLLRLRFPLAVSPQYPLGQFRPYLTAGPAILFVEGKQTSNLIGQTKSLRTPEFGLKAGAGFDVVIEKNVSLFTEYRYVYFQTTASFPGGGGNQDTLSTVFHLHTFLFGVSFHLDPGYRYPWALP